MRKPVILLTVLLGGTLASLAQDQDFSKVQIKVSKVAGGVYLLQGEGGNIAASVGEDGIVIVDDQFAPLADVHLPGAGGPGDDPRVTAHDVQPPAELGDPLADRRLDRREIPHVRAAGDDPPVQRLDLLDRLGQIVRSGHRVGDAADLGADVDRDDVGALLGQPDGVRPPLPPGRAGDEGDLTLELSCHFCHSFHFSHNDPRGSP